MLAPTRNASPDKNAIAHFLLDACGASHARVGAVNLLSGGAIQQNWEITVDITDGPHAGAHTWVLRTDAPATVASSLPREREFAIIRFAHANGLLAPKPLFMCNDATVIGRPFFVMEKLPGVAAGHKVVRLNLNRPALARELAAAAARIHAIRPPIAELPFLKTFLARDVIGACRDYLDTLDEPPPMPRRSKSWPLCSPS